MGIFLNASKISKTSDSEGYRKERIVIAPSSNTLEIRFAQSSQTLTGTELTAVERDFFNSWTSQRIDVIANPQNSEYRTVSNKFLIEVSRPDTKDVHREEVEADD